jgi:hypothetical protein
MNKPLTKKEKLIEKVRDLDSKLVALDIEIQSPLEDLHPSSLMNKFYSILDSLPNRVLAKIIRDAKAELKGLKLVEKAYKREQKRKEKGEE